MYSGTYTLNHHERDMATREAKAASERRQLRLTEIVKEIRSRTGAAYVQCNCDLDNWQPEPSTGHSHVCRIHKIALALLK